MDGIKEKDWERIAMESVERFQFLSRTIPMVYVEIDFYFNLIL